MMKIVLLPILSLFIYATHAEVNKILDQQPQQVHIAFGGKSRHTIITCPESFWTQKTKKKIAFTENTNEIVVTWSTMDETPDSLVEYGETDLNNTVRGTSTKFVDGGEAKHSQYIHKVWPFFFYRNPLYIKRLRGFCYPSTGDHQGAEIQHTIFLSLWWIGGMVSGISL